MILIIDDKPNTVQGIVDFLEKENKKITNLNMVFGLGYWWRKILNAKLIFLNFSHAMGYIKFQMI